MLLCESFNPHVRYGSCMALGIACAGTGNAVRGGGPARPGPGNILWSWAVPVLLTSAAGSSEAGPH